MRFLRGSRCNSGLRHGSHSRTVTACLPYLRIKQRKRLDNIVSMKVKTTKGDNMGMEEAIANAKSKIVSGQDAVLSEALADVYSAGKAEGQPAQGGGLSQADIDAAVAAAREEDGKALAQAQADAQADHASMQSSLDDLKKQFADLAAKEKIEAEAAGGFKGAMDDLQGKFDALKAVIAEALKPKPAPEEPAQ